MTYILSGRLGKSNYLIVDSISSDSQSKQKTFANKLAKLESSENTFFTFTGLQLLDNCIKSYDSWLFQNNRVNDFLNGDKSIEELIRVIDKNVSTYRGENKFSLKQNRIFFINREKSVIYDLDYGADNKLKEQYRKIELLENEFIDSVLFSNKQTFEFAETINTFEIAKNYIFNLGKNIDFKDRFSFIELFKNGTDNQIHPFKYYSDYIAYMNDIDYDIIDNRNFIWDI